MELKYEFSKFDDLKAIDLYQIIKLRIEVFIIEQNCIYQDLDDKDQLSFHLLGKHNDELISYARLLPEGVSYKKYVSIGRVIVKEKGRKKGTGYELISKAIEKCELLWPGLPIKISAQAHLQKFYNQSGFISEGEIYLEDDIPHIAMVRPVTI